MNREILDSGDPGIFELETVGAGPSGELPFEAEFLRTAASGDLFGWTQNAGMGWDPRRMKGPQVAILSTLGGIRRPDGSPVALGYHTGHWEVGLLVEAAAETIAMAGGIPFATFCSDPCDGRTQGTLGMFDSLAYRNDAAIILRRQARSLPTAKGVLGVATCDKGLPAMMMALVGLSNLPSVLIPGGVTLPVHDGEDLGKIQSIGVRFAHQELSLKEAAELGCKACGSPGGGCQFMGTAATSQVVAEALGLALPHSALTPSGSEIWLDMSRRSAKALLAMNDKGMTVQEIVTSDSIHNALVLHAAVGGSTNLIMHLSAIAHAAGLPRPTVEDWRRINQVVPRLVDVLPNGPVGFPTSEVFLAGGVPEIMLELESLDVLKLDARTVTGATLGDNLEWWRKSERRRQLRWILKEQDGVEAKDVIHAPSNAFPSTLTFLTGNIAPEGAVVKSTAIDPDQLDSDGVYRLTGRARVFGSEKEAIAAVKSKDDDAVQPGDVMVLIGLGPVGAGMPETAQITFALKYLSFGSRVALITDGRFSGVSTGPCIGHISPEAMCEGPIGKLRDGDLIEIEIDPRSRSGHIETSVDLSSREPHPSLRVHPKMPDDTRLWAALQQVGGGSWGGCVYDVDQIIKKLLREED